LQPLAFHPPSSQLDSSGGHWTWPIVLAKAAFRHNPTFELLAKNVSGK
jgi:hypothetical protein